MIIIGEKINGAIPAVKEAIQTRNADYIRDLAMKQKEAGAHFIDVCAGTEPKAEKEALEWLMDVVQDAVDLPLCIDSPNARTIEAVFNRAEKPGLINSVSLEGDKCQVIYPLIKGTEWQVIALTCNNHGIPSDVDTKVNIAKTLVAEAAQYDISPDRIHIDPLVMALSTENKSLLNFMESVKQIKSLYPTIKITSGLSNISFGMPARKIVNSNFMTLAIYGGMDSAIMNPLDNSMMGAVYATEALMGRDNFCRKYNKAFRKGIFAASK